jgi:hypothetical protein
MNEVMGFIVIGSAIWVLIDAKKIGVRKGLVSGMGNTTPWNYFFLILVLWIVFFPMYLYYRGKYKIAVAAAGGTVNSRTTAN